MSLLLKSLLMQLCGLDISPNNTVVSVVLSEENEEFHSHLIFQFFFYISWEFFPDPM